MVKAGIVGIDANNGGKVEEVGARSAHESDQSNVDISIHA
jgi:hypothetical protein